MIRNFYCLYDKKLEDFGSIFEQQDDKGCLVLISREIARGKLDFPEDYKVYKAGTQDSATGHFIPELILLADLAEGGYEKCVK